MAKKIKAVVKLNLPGGAATAAPPAGPVLGQHGVPIMDFVRQYNEATSNKKGMVIPVVITIYEDRTFSFVTKLTPVAESIKTLLKIKSGSAKPNRDKVGKLTEQQLEELAKKKLEDLNTTNLDQAKKIIAGTARSMGIDVIK
jgi:large subunit ribosomal protein L11